MKKKIINGILMAAMLFAGTTSFVSCKDNVDDVATGIYKDLDKVKNDLQLQIDALSTRVSALEGRMDAVEGRVTALEGEVAQIKKDIQALDTRVGNLEEEQAKLKARMDAAEAKIAEISKKYWDARHNCYAYVIGENSEISKCSDNGEPSGTAGRPILEVINGSGITNILIIVTRYFGGVLLGTGGLVRAYTQAAQAAVAASEVGELVYSQKLTVAVGYNMINNVQYYLAQNDINILDSRYEADVQFDICVKEADLEKIKAGLTQKCEGQLTITEGDKGYY